MRVINKTDLAKYRAEKEKDKKTIAQLEKDIAALTKRVVALEGKK